MAKMKSLAALLSLGLIISGCGNSSTGSTSKGKLVISTWGLNEEALWEEDFKPFEAICNCEVVLEKGTTSERYTKFSTNKNDAIDIILLSQSVANQAINDQAVDKVDYSKVPNAKNMLDNTQVTVDAGYGPAYAVNSIGIIYDPTKIDFEIKDWSDLWRPELKGAIAIPDITSTFGPAMLYIASDYKNRNIKDDKGAKAFEALEALKPNIVKTYSKSADLTNMFSSGEIKVAVVADFGFSVAKAAVPALEYKTPESGTYLNMNTIEVNPLSKNKELAYQYIDYRLSKETQERVGNGKLSEGPVNKLAVIEDAASKNMTYGEIAKNAKTVDFDFVNMNLKEWIDTWNRLINS